MNIEEEFLNEVVETKTRSTRRKGINSKNKGSNAERELAHILNERFKGYTFARSVSSGAYTGGQNRGRAETLDESQLLVFAGDIRVPKNFNFTIEHKFYKSLDFYDLFNPSSKLFDWYSQSEADAKMVNKEPLLIVKTNNHKRIAFVNMSYLVKHPNINSNIVFIHKAKGCFWLEDLLKEPDSFFFEGE